MIFIVDLGYKAIMITMRLCSLGKVGHLLVVKVRFCWQRQIFSHIVHNYLVTNSDPVVVMMTMITMVVMVTTMFIGLVGVGMIMVIVMMVICGGADEDAMAKMITVVMVAAVVISTNFQEQRECTYSTFCSV